MIATRNKSQNGTTALLPSFLGSGNRSLLPRKTIYYQSKVLIFIGKGYTTATVCLASLLPHFYQMHNGLKNFLNFKIWREIQCKDLPKLHFPQSVKAECLAVLKM